MSIVRLPSRMRSWGQLPAKPESGGGRHTVKRPKLIVPTNLHREMVRAAMLRRLNGARVDSQDVVIGGVRCSAQRR